MKRLILIATIAAMTGCTSPGATDVSGSAGNGEVKVIALEDGTRCAVLIGSGKGAISCDWSRSAP
jgi:phosphopantothenate synthetase